jgi:uridine kinase
MAAGVPVVGICGPSAAGKSVLAAALCQRLEAQRRRCLVLACDNYYRTPWDAHGPWGFDTVDAIDLPCLRQELAELQAGRCRSLRTYDMATRNAGRMPLTGAPPELILLEGAYGPQALVELNAFALLVYVQTPLPLRLLRRLRRDQRQRQRSARYVLQQTLLQTLPGERRFIRPLRRQADLIVRDPRHGIEPLTAQLSLILNSHT